METYTLERDIKVFYTEAGSFPNGIKPAFDKLHSLLQSQAAGRNFFGISYPQEPGKIIYRAAVEENFEGEGETLGCATFIIRKGKYIGIYIKDFMKNITAIGNAFQELIQHPEIDPDGYCLEIYEGMAHVKCLVPLRSGK